MTGFHVRTLLAALAVLVPLASRAQQPAFDVASVKPEDPGRTHGSRQNIDHGRLNYSNVSLLDCLESAYQVDGHFRENYQIAAPPWLKSERFTIVAQAPSGTTRTQAMLMLQTLLAERFRLVVHHEERPMNVFALVISRGGPKLTEAVGRRSAYVGPSEPGNPDTAFRSAPISLLTWRLKIVAGRPVIDETGLRGVYDFRLPIPAMLLNGPNDLPADPDFSPSLFTSLRERLGLELRPEKAPVDVLVVDHVERPTRD